MCRLVLYPSQKQQLLVMEASFSDPVNVLGKGTGGKHSFRACRTATGHTARLYFLLPFFNISQAVFPSSFLRYFPLCRHCPSLALSHRFSVTQILCHIKAVACPVHFRGRSGTDVVKLLGRVFIPAETRTHSKLAEHGIAREVSNKTRSLVLCTCSHKTHILEENCHDG